MYEFEVSGMSCGHCAATIARAVRATNEAAEVEVDLEAGRVRVRSSQQADEVARAIGQAGYPVLRTARA